MLLDATEHSGSYYLCGYAVEAGLKACLVKQFRAHTLPDKAIVTKSYTHSLDELIRISGLSNCLNDELDRDPLFATNWAVAKDWDESSRYKEWTQEQASEIFNSVSNKRNGVMKWVRRVW